MANLGAPEAATDAPTGAGAPVADRQRAKALESALDQVPDAVAIVGPDSVLQWTNAAFARLSGYASDEAIGRDAFSLLQSPVHAPALYATLRGHVRDGQPWRGSLVGLRKNGTAVEQLVSVTPRPGADGQSVAGAIIVSQFLEPLLSSTPGNREATSSIAALVLSEQRFRVMLERAGDAIMVFDFDDAHAVDVNPAACELFGYSRTEFLKLTGANLGGPEAAASVARMSASLQASGEGHDPRHAMRKKDGSRFIADVRIQTYEFMGRRQYLVIARDVSAQVDREHALERSNHELAETRQRLLHSDRLVSLGHLAASVAHEINNPLQYMQTAIDTLQRVALSEQGAAPLAALQEGVQRVGAVTRALLPFSRVDGFRAERLGLADVVEMVRRMTSSLVSQRAAFTIDLDRGLFVRGDRTLLAQLLTNLVTNAAHAVGEGAPDQNEIAISAAREGDRVVVSVRDTGGGIPDSLRDRIFEPFFTTKPSELGTGLGLPLCLDIAEQHGGTLRFVSELGAGTTFFISLPIAAAEAPSVRKLPEPALAPAALRAKVLVVDDEALVAECYRIYLRTCEVDIALGGEEALELLSAQRDYDVIVCDLMMPGMDGPKVYEEVEARWPGLERRIIFCSGGAFTERSRAFIGRVAPLMLDKPVSTPELTRAIAEVVAREGHAPQA